MSRTQQISVTLPEDLIDTVKAAVARGEARSVSAYIASRLAPGVIMDALFTEWDADRGVPSEETKRRAQSALDRVLTEQAARSTAGDVA